MVASQSTQNSLNSLNTVIIAIFQRIYAVEHDDGVINIRIAGPLIRSLISLISSLSVKVVIC